MSSATGRIREAVNDIQQWLATSPHPGEAVVRQAIVLRLLQAAGFDIWNPAEVVPEETNATGNRADFLIRVDQGKFALEIKGMGVTLGAVQFQQAATYAVNEGTRWAIVTNGRVWIAIDEHLPGRWEERVAVRVELGQEGDTFAADLATLLDAGTWRADAFAGAVATVQKRQQQRHDEARIHREKCPVVEATQEEFSIATFEKAAAAAVQMGRITEAERAVLLGIHNTPASAHAPVERPASPKSRRARTVPMLTPYTTNKSSESTNIAEIHFVYHVGGAQAHAAYCPTDRTWTVKAGSTAILEVQPYAQDIQRRRAKLIEAGQLRQQDEQFLVYLMDTIYPSPSAAAGDVSGGSKNGWDVWVDEAGRSAQYHRPKTQPD